jgi:hypothetical protein
VIALSPDPMMHDSLIAAHALSAVIAFALGIALALRRSRHPGQAMAYALALTLMALFVTGAVILDWPSLTLAAQGIFTALLALAAYAVWRGWQARNKLAGRRRELSAVDDIGFTLITLFVGFVVILVNDLGGPAWLMAVLGILAIAAGRRAVGLIKARRHPRGREPEPDRGAGIRPDQRELDEPANRHGSRH